MKVYNLTDIPTPSLESYGMLNQSIPIGEELAPPGGFVEIATADEAVVRASLEHFLSIGAVAIDTVPDTYKSTRPESVPLPMRQHLAPEPPEVPPAVTEFEPLPMRGFAADTPPAEDAPAEDAPAPALSPDEPTPESPPAEPVGEPTVVKRSRRKE